MASRLMIMAAFENGTAEGVIHGNVDTAFVGKDAHFNLPVGEPGTERKGNVFMHGLESLKDEGVAHGGGFYAMREGSVN